MNKSESITKLAAALCKFHSQMGKVGKDSVNPHFRNKYASLSNLIEAVTPHLNAVGLTVVQMPTVDGLNTLLLHESGEYISSLSAIASKDPMNPQAVGSAITYARRYALGAVLSLNIDEDDDANAAATPPPAKPAQPKVVDHSAAIADINAATTIGELQAAWGRHKAAQTHPEVIAAKDALKLTFSTPKP
jgi:hypothetical protein